MISASLRVQGGPNHVVGDGVGVERRATAWASGCVGVSITFKYPLKPRSYSQTRVSGEAARDMVEAGFVCVEEWGNGMRRGQDRGRAEAGWGLGAQAMGAIGSFRSWER